MSPCEVQQANSGDHHPGGSAGGLPCPGSSRPADRVAGEDGVSPDPGRLLGPGPGPRFFIAVEAGSLAFAGVGESIADARMDAARHRRVLGEIATRQPRSAPTAPLSPALRRWAADLLVFRLVDGEP
jgi:hypothetical protein